ncbi:MAG TPA: hydrogenase maturation protease [Actinomycetota bacterium]|nr:hydrogenase maturation protease [Actinomycetota bacterium]
MTVVRVIGCGNPDAGDDGAGIVAVERARRALESIPGVEVLPSVSPVDVVHHLDGSDGVVVADAIRTPGGTRRPGTVVRAVAGPEGLPAEIRSSLSSHGFGVVEAFGLVRAIGPVPRLVLVGVEAEETAAGRPMSHAVREALPDLVESVVREARGLAAQVERAPTGGSSGPLPGEERLAR